MQSAAAAMSKKPKGRKRAQLASSAEASSSTAATDSTIISKTQKRKLQKKRAKLNAKETHDAEAKARAEKKAAKRAAKAAAEPPASEPHPVPQPLVFAAAEDDHCETAPEAYADIVPLLRLIAHLQGVAPDALRIYDPYYCNGAVARHLDKLGFPNVHNRNEDCYAVWANKAMPPHDVVVTNPPYSADHPERLLRFLARNKKPWLALMPNWVSQRDYYKDATEEPSPTPVFYLVPTRRYHYWTPKGRRADVQAGGAKAKTHGHTNAALGARTSPFVSFWYCGGIPSGELRKSVAYELKKDLAESSSCRVCWHLKEVPPEVLR